MSPLAQLLTGSAIVAALLAAPIVVPIALIGTAWAVTLLPALL